MYLIKYIVGVVVLMAFMPPLAWSSRVNTTENTNYFLLTRTSNGIRPVYFSGTDLYDDTLESLQWLAGPTDIRRYNIFSPSSQYQINRRYRYDPSVVRYYGYQLWKLHETDLTSERLNEFWNVYG